MGQSRGEIKAGRLLDKIDWADEANRERTKAAKGLVELRKELRKLADSDRAGGQLIDKMGLRDVEFNIARLKAAAR